MRRIASLSFHKIPYGEVAWACSSSSTWLPLNTLTADFRAITFYFLSENRRMH